MALLEELGSFYATIPFRLLLWGHCLLVASWFSHLKARYLLSYWTGLIGAFGGGLVSGLLIQRADQAPNAIFTNNDIILAWTISWWLVNYAPFGLVHKLVTSLPVRTALGSCTNTLRAGLIVSRVDLAAGLYVGMVAPPLVLGTLGGSGGKLLVDGLLGGLGLSSAASELWQPGFPVRSGFTAALLQYLFVHIVGSLSPMEGKGLVTTLLVAHGVLKDLTGRPLDFTAPLAAVVLRVANIPTPEVAAKSGAKHSGKVMEKEKGEGKKHK